MSSTACVLLLSFRVRIQRIFVSECKLSEVFFCNIFVYGFGRIAAASQR